MNKTKENLPWVLIEIAGVVYAISSEYVLSLSRLNEVTPIPKAPKEIRGVIDFRGQIIELADIRKILNLKTSAEEIKEFYDMMDARRQDHINWLNKLEECVLNETEFSLTTDPHKCAFGKWYDSYNSESHSIMFIVTFSKFDRPHKIIHDIGIKAKKFIENNDRQSAIGLIEATKNNELKQMMNLFEEVKIAFKESRREIIVVIGENNNNISMSVDKIIAIEHLTEIDQDLIKSTVTDTKYLSGIGKRKDGSSVLLLNDDYIISKFLKKNNKSA